MQIETPSDAAGQTYDQALSRTRKKETERRFLSERKEQILLEIVTLESHLGISSRWTPLTPEYQEAVQYSATRDYHRVLDRLQRLVVQRLFELHKLNLNFTSEYQSNISPYNNNTMSYLFLYRLQNADAHRKGTTDTMQGHPECSGSIQ